VSRIGSGVLLPTVSGLRLLLESKGVRGMKVLLEPRSFRYRVPSRVGTSGIGFVCIWSLFLTEYIKARWWEVD
jgi:hypothetical protein